MNTNNIIGWEGQLPQPSNAASQKRERTLKLKNETTEEYLKRFMKKTPKQYAERFLADFYSGPFEGMTEAEIEEVTNQSSDYDQRERDRLKINAEVRKMLTDRFDDLFELTTRYSEEFKKTYYTYTFEYARSWSDFPHLVIRNDIDDYFYTKEYLKRQEEWDGNHSSAMTEFFDEWLTENLWDEDIDQDVLEEIWEDDDFLEPYFEALLDIIGEDNNVIDTEPLREIHQVSTTPQSWSFLRRGQDNGETYASKEEAFDGYLSDTNYGFYDLDRDSGGFPSWLEEILKLVKNDDGIAVDWDDFAKP